MMISKKANKFIISLIPYLVLKNSAYCSVSFTASHGTSRNSLACTEDR